MASPSGTSGLKQPKFLSDLNDINQVVSQFVVPSFFSLVCLFEIFSLAVYFMLNRASPSHINKLFALFSLSNATALFLCGFVGFASHGHDASSEQHLSRHLRVRSSARFVDRLKNDQQLFQGLRLAADCFFSFSSCLQLAISTDRLIKLSKLNFRLWNKPVCLLPMILAALALGLSLTYLTKDFFFETPIPGSADPRPTSNISIYSIPSQSRSEAEKRSVEIGLWCKYLGVAAPLLVLSLVMVALFVRQIKENRLQNLRFKYLFTKSSLKDIDEFIINGRIGCFNEQKPARYENASITTSSSVFGSLADTRNSRAASLAYEWLVHLRLGDNNKQPTSSLSSTLSGYVERHVTIMIMLVNFTFSMARLTYTLGGFFSFKNAGKTSAREAEFLANVVNSCLCTICLMNFFIYFFLNRSFKKKIQSLFKMR